MDLISQTAIRASCSDGTIARLTLPGVFVALVRDEIESFAALRPHQRHAWHSFLALVGALALLAAGRDDLPEDEESWAALLRGLTPDYPHDEPWSLIAPPDRPALLQPPLPGGRLEDLKNLVETPDALDMLVTAKNHDLKTGVMAKAEPDDWLFALVTLQTMEGFLGAGNYGISKMNGGFANRAAISVAPGRSPGRHLRRDIRRLLGLRGARPDSVYPASGGLGLVWLRPWDGTTSLRPAELDPYYVDICRRVRLVEQGGRLAARTGGSKVPRIVPIPGGVTGDPWAPVVMDKDGSKVFTADARGFGYRRMVQLLFDRATINPSPLQMVAPDEGADRLVVIARALTRGQGKTEGYHERRVPLSNAVQSFLRKEATDPLASVAQERVNIAGVVQNRVLKAALLALFENGPDQIDFRDEGAGRRAEAFLKRFDEAVDRDFFPRLWEEFEEGADGEQVRRAWVAGLLRIARDLVDEADRGASKAVKRRYRARARADAVLYGAPRRIDTISRYLEEVA